MEGSTSLKASMVLKMNMLCHYQLISFNTIILQNIVKNIQPVMPCSATRALPPEQVFSFGDAFLNFANTLNKYEYDMTAWVSLKQPPDKASVNIKVKFLFQEGWVSGQGVKVHNQCIPVRTRYSTNFKTSFKQKVSNVSTIAWHYFCLQGSHLAAIGLQWALFT